MIRSKRKMLKEIEIIVRTPSGKTAYTIPVLHVMNYTVDEIFKKKLYFLIPFFIFNMESELPVIDISPCGLDAMMELYADLV